MGGVRSKLIWSLIVYCAGFLTAIYCLAPVPADSDNPDSGNKTFWHSVLKSDDFGNSLRAGLDQCVKAGAKTANRAAEMVKEKINKPKNSG